MSIRIMAAVWESGPEAQGDLLVMLALADWCNDQGECWPSMAGIAEKARLSDQRSARRIVRRLEASGWIEIDAGGGRHGCNKYVLKLGPKAPRTESPPRTVEPSPPGLSLPETRTVEPPEPSLPVKEPSISFDDFWKVWPKKEAKGDAEKAWKAAVRQASPERIIAGIATSPQTNREKKFIPSAGKWLRNKGWEDEGPHLRAVPSVSDADLRAKRVEFIKSGKDYLTRSITATQARELIEAGLVTPEECRKAGVSC